MAHPFTDQFWRALAHYRITITSLGSDAATWRTEYDRVSRTAFASLLITNSSQENSTHSGEALFPQAVLVDALHCRRFELDNGYTLPEHLAAFVSAKTSRARAGRGGVILRFGQ